MFAPGRFCAVSAQATAIDPSTCSKSRCVMSPQELQEFHTVTFLSAMAMEAVVLWDDLSEKLEDDPSLCAALGVTQGELTVVAETMRKLLDSTHDRKTDLQRTLEAAMQPVQAPARRFPLDDMWAAAEASHAHLPSALESVLLPNATPPRSGPDETTTTNAEDQEEPAGH